MNQTDEIEELLDWADKKAELVVQNTSDSALEVLLKKGAKIRQKITCPYQEELGIFFLNAFKKYNQKIRTIDANKTAGDEKFLIFSFQTKAELPFKIGLNSVMGYCLIDGFLGGVNGISIKETKTDFSAFEKNILKQILTETAEKFLHHFSLEISKKTHLNFEKPERNGVFFDLKTTHQTGTFFLQIPSAVQEILAQSFQEKISLQQIKTLPFMQQFYCADKTYSLKEIYRWETGTKILLDSSWVVGKIQSKTVNTGILKGNKKNITILLEKTDFP